MFKKPTSTTRPTTWTRARTHRPILETLRPLDPPPNSTLTYSDQGGYPYAPYNVEEDRLEDINYNRYSLSADSSPPPV
jgi:hypothetical protein